MTAILHRRRPIAAALLATSAAISGCGHPATRAECEEILTRSAQIELAGQKITDPAIVEQRVAEARAARGQELMDRCVGKRITDDALACIRRAETSAQLDKCLD